MAVRSEREKSKMQEKYQMVLSQLLKEDDNRFCVDCDTKSNLRSTSDTIVLTSLLFIPGPRWASWNLGIFICIRCAGFHRNLGVHISKVKSVNLDSWTAEQIAVRTPRASCPHPPRLSFQSVQAMGNNRGRAVYEANMPTGFRRPQTDSYVSMARCSYLTRHCIYPRALETFIRSKYEQRKWIAKDWIPPEITVSSDVSVVLAFSSHRRTMCLARLATHMDITD